MGRALSVCCVLDACELGGETGFAERLSDGRLELIRLLLGGRFGLGDRFDPLLLDAVFLLDEVAGRLAFDPFDDEERF